MINNKEEDKVPPAANLGKNTTYMYGHGSVVSPRTGFTSL